LAKLTRELRQLFLFLVSPPGLSNSLLKIELLLSAQWFGKTDFTGALVPIN
jgi:hypothetical protein